MPRSSLLAIWWSLAVVLGAWLVLAPLAPPHRAPTRPRPEVEPAGAAAQPLDSAQDLVRRIPVAFVENQGQWDFPARYVARFGAMAVFLEERGWALSLEQRVEESPDGDPPAGRGWERLGHPGDDSAMRPRVRGAGLRMTFAGAHGARAIVAEDKLSGHHNYFLGNDPAKWRTGVGLYGAVRYRGLYPGVDLRCYDKQGRFEYDLELTPGIDLAQIEVVVEGASALRLDADGALVIDTAAGPLRQLPPCTYEVDAAGVRHALASRYELRARDRFAFAVPEWSGERALVLDPGIVYSTFVGGSDTEWAYGLAVDASGVATIAGFVDSPNFPTTPGAWDRGYGGSTLYQSTDAFVTRLDPSRPAAQQLVYSTFVGGNSDKNEGASALSVDASGVVTIAGVTSSPDFPTTPGAWDTTYNGNGDAFVTRLDPSLPAAQQLVYSTFVGGSSREELNALSVNASGVATTAGATYSPNFPTTHGVWDTTFNGSSSGNIYDAFVTRLDPSLPAAQQLVYSTFVGGSLNDSIGALSVDASGVATIGGYTTSTEFPTTPGAWDTTYSGGHDAFVAWLDPSRPAAQQLVYSTFVGGNDFDATRALSVDASGVVTIAGGTRSPNFPTTPGAWDTTHNGGGGDAFVARLDPSRPSAEQLVYSTVLGGSDGDSANALSVDASGVATAAGTTFSPDFPTTPGAWDTTFGTDIYPDAWVARLDPSRPAAQQLVYSTFMGGARSDFAQALAVDAAGAATVAGVTSSPQFPTTPGAWNTTHNGVDDAFVTRLDMLPQGVSTYGSSSPGCHGPLAISVTSWPQIGNAVFSIAGGNASPASNGALALGTGQLSIPIVALGVSLWVDLLSPVVLVPVTSSAGGAVDLPVPIPANPLLVGQSIFAQLLWLGPTSPPPCPPLGLSASSGLSITFLP